MRLNFPVCGALCVSIVAAEGLAPLETYTAIERRHWAFQKRSNPDVPTFTAPTDQAWAKNPIDAFVLARLKKEGLRPSMPADRSDLIRRVYFDVTGLPPSPAEVAAFKTDRSADAYSKLVDLCGR